VLLVLVLTAAAELRRDAGITDFGVSGFVTDFKSVRCWFPKVDEA
jgi:hypothetical protein